MSVLHRTRPPLHLRKSRSSARVPTSSQARAGELLLTLFAFSSFAARLVAHFSDRRSRFEITGSLVHADRPSCGDRRSHPADHPSCQDDSMATPWARVDRPPLPQG